MLFRSTCIACGQERVLTIPPESALCRSCATRARNRRINFEHRAEIVEPILLAIRDLLGRVAVYLDLGLTADQPDTIGRMNRFMTTLDDRLAQLLTQARARQHQPGSHPSGT